MLHLTRANMMGVVGIVDARCCNCNHEDLDLSRAKVKVRKCVHL